MSQPTRLWFLARGCKQVPPELIDGKVLWAHPDGYFMSAYGAKQKPSFSPAMRKKGNKANNGKRGFIHPNMRHFGCKMAHRLIFETFAQEPCPIFFNSKGKPYKGIVHHLIENPYDIRLDNLMGWLTYKQHYQADKRRRALEAAVPDGDLCVFTYERQRTLQDPRITSDDQFEKELELIKKHPFVKTDPDKQISYELTHHCEL